jgi:hypothetical protein
MFYRPLAGAKEQEHSCMIPGSMRSNMVYLVTQRGGWATDKWEASLMEACGVTHFTRPP